MLCATPRRCICESQVDKPGRTLQCSLCRTRVHTECMGLVGKEPATFYCDVCRVARSDPFWQVLDGTIMAPGRLRYQGRTVPVRGPRLPDA